MVNEIEQPTIAVLLKFPKQNIEALQIVCVKKNTTLHALLPCVLNQTLDLGLELPIIDIEEIKLLQKAYK
jgi:hypothetical protein